MNSVAGPDVAAVAAAALGDARSRNAAIALGSDYAGPSGIVELVRETSGRELAVERAPQEALVQRFAAAHGPVERSFCAPMLPVADGEPVDGTPGFRRPVERRICSEDFAMADAA